MQVHHLTYERIFNEPPEDLMVLCRYHHIAAEEVLFSGKVARRGDVHFLRVRTLEEIKSYGKKLKTRNTSRKKQNKKAKRPRKQKAQITPDGKALKCVLCDAAHDLFYINFKNGARHLAYYCGDQRRYLRMVKGLPIPEK